MGSESSPMPSAGSAFLMGDGQAGSANEIESTTPPRTALGSIDVVSAS